MSNSNSFVIRVDFSLDNTELILRNLSLAQNILKSLPGAKIIFMIKGENEKVERFFEGLPFQLDVLPDHLDPMTEIIAVKELANYYEAKFIVLDLFDQNHEFENYGDHFILFDDSQFVFLACDNESFQKNIELPFFFKKILYKNHPPCNGLDFSEHHFSSFSFEIKDNSPDGLSTESDFFNFIVDKI